MRQLILTLGLLILGSLSLAGQDVVISGNADFKRLCEGSTLPKVEGWVVVSKNVSAAGLSPEYWYGLAQIKKSGDNYVATLGYGPVRCDNMVILADRLLVHNSGSKYSAVCLVDGKWKPVLKGYTCDAVLIGHADGARAKLLIRDRKGLYSWIDEGGKHLSGTPEHYDKALLYNGNKEVVAVKSGAKWGVMSPDARVVVPIQYDTLFLTAPLRRWGGKWADANWFFVNDGGRWGVRGDDGSEPFPTVYGGLSYWPTAPDSWCYHMPGGKWGMKESGGRQILPEEYDGLSTYSFSPPVSGSLRLPFAIIAGRGKGRALLNHKGNELLPFMEDADRFDMLVMFYPQKSFSVFTWNRYKLWTKGEFESTAEFEARKQDPSKAAGYVASLLPAAEKAFAAAILGNDARLILSRYDADSECFLFSVDKILQDTYRIRVPRADAPLFKEEFKDFSAAALGTAKYFIQNDMLARRSIVFTTPEGKSFSFENPAAEGYSLPVLKDLDLIQ